MRVLLRWTAGAWADSSRSSPPWIKGGSESWTDMTKWAETKQQQNINVFAKAIWSTNGAQSSFGLVTAEQQQRLRALLNFGGQLWLGAERKERWVKEEWNWTEPPPSSIKQDTLVWWRGELKISYFITYILNCTMHVSPWTSVTGKQG